ncbi:MAG TPA: ATP-binding cassette domain-containing protein, partial [Geminicoccaceae bacterium]
MSAPPLLSLRDLAVEVPDATGRGWRRIVDAVSLEVAPGEVLGLIGESGAGKTTLGLAALGYARTPARFAGGQVLLGGADLLRIPARALGSIRGRRVAYVAQSAAAAFNPARTIDSQLAEVPLRHRLAAG